jgi:hypothetical protein
MKPSFSNWNVDAIALGTATRSGCEDEGDFYGPLACDRVSGRIFASRQASRGSWCGVNFSNVEVSLGPRCIPQTDPKLGNSAFLGMDNQRMPKQVAFARLM